jgi:DNA mismatch repair protein MutS2
MNYFLKKCNKHTLFLIDEFGTGSDPELGGALAETFLEVFYEREAFGIITTHYSNLKLLANELPHIQNANMLFDEKTLLPLYKLVIGQAVLSKLNSTVFVKGSKTIVGFWCGSISY